jgi:hypothetical protein
MQPERHKQKAARLRAAEEPAAHSPLKKNQRRDKHDSN